MGFSIYYTFMSQQTKLFTIKMNKTFSLYQIGKKEAG